MTAATTECKPHCASRCPDAQRNALRQSLPAAAGILTLLAILGLALLLDPLIAPSKFMYGPGLARRLLTWDGLWYRSIAQHGYHWDAAVGTMHGRYQNVAFFPLFPLFDFLLERLTGAQGSLLYIVSSIAFDGLSIIAFAEAAKQTLPLRARTIATVLYAGWPASCFAFMGYPVGLINLCAILAIADRSAGRKWRCAAWCGAGTAAAPMLVFLAAAIALGDLTTACRSRRAGPIIASLARGALSGSGLAAFMGYLAATIGSAVSFVAAQNAWAPAVSTLHHIENGLSLVTYLFPIYAFAKVLLFASVPGILHSMSGRLLAGWVTENLMGLLTASLIVVLLLKARKVARDLLAPNLFMLFGYLWFMVTGGHSFVEGMRLLYPGIALLLPIEVVRGPLATERSIASQPATQLKPNRDTPKTPETRSENPKFRLVPIIASICASAGFLALVIKGYGIT